jgi:hypothetical protein
MRGVSGWRGGRPSVRHGFCGDWCGGAVDGVSPVDGTGGCGVGVLIAALLETFSQFVLSASNDYWTEGAAQLSLKVSV